jgi:hypothetical protein
MLLIIWDKIWHVSTRITHLAEYQPIKYGLMPQLVKNAYYSCLSDGTTCEKISQKRLLQGSLEISFARRAES